MSLAVFFDAGGTLLKVRQSVGITYAEFAARYGVKLDVEKVREAFPRVFRSLHIRDPRSIPRNGDDRAWWHEVVRRCLEIGGWPAGRPTDEVFEALYWHYEQASCWELFPDTVPVLKRLKEIGIPCYVLSNWDSRLRTILRGLGIYDYFEDHIISAEVGHAKPHAGIYDVALSRADVRADQAIMVGNEMEMDVAPPLALGWRAAFAVDRPRRDLGYLFTLIEGV
ncbi:MAG: HAD-IA family hydrolase [Methylacidiphilales bacterium]|nr:HAD-IA family hydrolase [Candidatus Methylacidiphilales bacterium]MDW8350056.1 HAD-IA family hydrolase [Verrucomicrobiae bacterium]